MATLHDPVSTQSVPERAGVLWSVAERFTQRMALAPLLAAPPAEQLRMLVRSVERFLSRDLATPAEEHDFVEGAGALLGVILIAHFRRARHRASGASHRLELGEYGYFDPFAAIESALQSDEPRVLLAREVARAEAEHRSEGPLSRVVKSLVGQLEVSRPDLALVDHFDLRLSLAARAGGEPFQVDLTRAVESTASQHQAAVDRVVSRLVSMLPGAAAVELDLEAARMRLLPRLSAAGALEELSVRGQSALFSLPVASGLSLALQVEQEGRARYVRAREVVAWGLDQHAGAQLAIQNLAQRSARFRLVRDESAHGAIYVARTGDGLDSARVLVPALHRQLTERLGAAPCVGIPHRDTFFACASGDERLVAELRERTRRDAARAPHPVSSELFTLVEPGVLAPN